MSKLTKSIADVAHSVVAVITGSVPEPTPEAIVAAGRKQRRTEAKQADAAVTAKQIADDTQAHIEAAAKTKARKSGVVDHGPSNKAIADMLKREAIGAGIEGKVIGDTPRIPGRLKTLEESLAQGVKLIVSQPGKPDVVSTIGGPKEAPPIPTTGYTGPMRALRDRVKAGAYVKAANGQPSCGDEVAQILGALEPVEVIKACMVAMDLAANPYPHLNIGQQSMNLRNKLRGQLKRGEIGMGVVREAVEVVMEARPAKAPAAVTALVKAIEAPAAAEPAQEAKKPRKAKSPRAIQGK